MTLGRFNHVTTVSKLTQVIITVKHRQMAQQQNVLSVVARGTNRAMIREVIVRVAPHPPHPITTEPKADSIHQVDNRARCQIVGH